MIFCYSSVNGLITLTLVSWLGFIGALTSYFLFLNFFLPFLFVIHELTHANWEHPWHDSRVMCEMWPIILIPAFVVCVCMCAEIYTPCTHILVSGLCPLKTYNKMEDDFVLMSFQASMAEFYLHQWILLWQSQLNLGFVLKTGTSFLVLPKASSCGMYLNPPHDVMLGT